MIKERGRIFETNSSSSDSYCEEKDYAKLTQTITLNMEFDYDESDNYASYDRFCHWIMNDDKLDKAIYDEFAFYYDDVNDNPCIKDIDWNTIYLEFTFRVGVHYVGEYRRGNVRGLMDADPDEYPEPELDDFECVPTDEFSDKAKIAERILAELNKNPEKIEIKSVEIKVEDFDDDWSIE